VNEPIGYLMQMNLALLEGLERWPSSLLEPHRRFLLSQQESEGGFRGRSAGADLYYTSFALRALAVMQSLEESVIQRSADYLRQRLSGSTQVVDFFAWLLSAALVQLGGCDLWSEAPPDWRERVAGLLERFRSADGGYGKTPAAPHGSTYTTFLVSLTAELLGLELPDKPRIQAFIQSRRREDGGFVESHAQRRGSTNPTAAAIGVLQLLGKVDEDTAASASDFLCEMFTPLDGGLRANSRIPLADLLSTFTGAWTLVRLGVAHRLPWPRLCDFALSCADPQGGFRGGLWDEQPDVEYTFYGLGVLALAALQDPSLPQALQ
jgi:geranylgeranyl transferase type-2 subunit beta